MAKYTVYANETVYESCEVEANSPEEARQLACGMGEGECIWDMYDSDDFEIERVELETGDN